jgi:hypothetical protein
VFRFPFILSKLFNFDPIDIQCSIDNLLERTVKHMMYLRMVTSQAEKLKRVADREVRLAMFLITYIQMLSSISKNLN